MFKKGAFKRGCVPTATLGAWIDTIGTGFRWNILFDDKELNAETTGYVAPLPCQEAGDLSLKLIHAYFLDCSTS